MNIFTKNIIPGNWNGELHVSTIPGKTDWRRTLNEVPIGDTVIAPGFEFNGASVGPLRFAFPKWKHPIATVRHDKRCNQAALPKAEAKKYPYFSPAAKLLRKRYKMERKFADDQFKIDVGVNGTKWEQRVGFIGVRIGAFF